MSGSNAISGITLIGAIASLKIDNLTFAAILGTVAVAFATINVVGGYMVTNRMLEMFKKKTRTKEERHESSFHQLCLCGISGLIHLWPKNAELTCYGPTGQSAFLLGMLIAIIVTLMNAGLDYKWVFLGILIGSGIGAFAALRVEMTAMPEMVALFNGFGGISSLLLAWAEYHQNRELFSVFIAIVAFLSAFIGGVTFSGSMVAFAKLSGKITQKAVVFKGQHIINGVLLLLTLIAAVIFCITPASTFGYVLFTLILLVALGFGISSTIPIGGADMPVVISLLNSYSGLAACAAGFVISNNILIVAGALVGASGIILTNIMCKAMNRSLVNVLFSGFGNTTEGQDGVAPQGEVRPASAEDVYYILEAADAVVFVPGYGLAVAQAQHAVKELGDLLEKTTLRSLTLSIRLPDGCPAI